MSLFSNTSSSYLGIDFDSHSVKVVELKNEKGKPRLVTYGYYDHDLEKRLSEKDENMRKEIAAIILEVCRKANTKSKVAIAGLPAFSVFSSIVRLPALSKKDLASAIKWEAKKVVPLPIEEMILHWDILEENAADMALPKVQIEGKPELPLDEIKETEKKNTFISAENFSNIPRKKGLESAKILLTAAPKDLVLRYMEIFKHTDITLLSLDTEQFALIRALVGYDTSSLMIVDIDFTVTNISIIQNGIPFLNRSINVGGLTITKAIANSLNINLQRAEQFKYDIGLNVSETASSEIPKTIEAAFAAIIDEIRYSMNLFKTQGNKNSLEKIILTGGSSLLAHLPAYISHIFQIRAVLGDPWARIIYPEELKPALNEIGPRFSVAIGLAMKEIR